MLSGVGAGTAAQNDEAIKKLIQLYPDNPALGSPFGTGNETFGLSPGFKRYAAMREYLSTLLEPRQGSDLKMAEGDIMFQSQNKHFREVSVNAGVPVYAYKFADPQNTAQNGGTSSPISCSRTWLTVYAHIV